MTYLDEITANKTNPQGLEALFLSARSGGEALQFATDLNASLAAEPDNLLLQAWHYRLLSAPEEPAARAGAGPNWKLAIPLAILNGLILWSLSGEKLAYPRGIPYIALLAAPITAIFVMGFLYFTGRENNRASYRRYLLIGAALAVLAAAAFLLVRLLPNQTAMDYQILMVPHLALLAWAGVGAALVGLASRADSQSKQVLPFDARNRFAFLAKSIEVFIVAGVYLIAGVAVGLITVGMFSALSVKLPDVLMRLIAVGGAGLIPLVAVATIYDPLAQPADQDFSAGLSKFIETMMHLLLPLSLGVLVLYMLVLPFNFKQPFNNRDVLIVFNVMLFAIMGLLVGATPVDLGRLSPGLASALRKGILAVAFLAVLISLHALAALLFRTANGGLTINRLTMIGWNIINIGLLSLIVARLLGTSPTPLARSQPWNERIKAVYSLGAVIYVGWTLLVIVVFPFLFR